ncbi:LysR family transcriptional regulator [Streptomyces sp. NPDC052687]|uniref:LysR family transcriptional regulator n=1 Tax=Streptomyces sp. NPDC052687 TaxID=3154759 RepID=UPI00343A4F0C
MFERLELEAFLTLAEELHFGRTAERLHVTTGRVSQTIKQLERRVGTDLFERTNRSVRLTPLGLRLYEDVRPAYEQLRTAMDRAVAAVRRARSTLRVGYVGAAAGQVVHRAADLFARQEPDCLVRARETQVAEALQRLRAGDVDVLVTSLPLAASDIAVGPVIFSEARMLAVPSRHPLSGRTAVVMEDLGDIPLLRLAGALPGDWPSDRWPERTPEGRLIRSGPRFETFQEALHLVGTGSGGVIVGAQVTRFYGRPDITYIPFSDAPPVDWAPVWLKSGTTPLVRAFAHTAREAADQVHREDGEDR